LGGGAVAAQERPAGEPTTAETPDPCVPSTNDGTPENGYAPGSKEGSREFCQIWPSSQCFSSTGLTRVTSISPGLTRTGGPSSYSFEFILREALGGPTGPPGRVLRNSTVVVPDIPFFPNVTQDAVVLPTPGPASLPDTIHVCISWSPPGGAGPFIGVDQSTGTSFIVGYTRANGTGPWEPMGPPTNPSHRALLLDGNGEEAPIFGSGFNAGTTDGWVVHR
jgi:hypothetical protein